MDNTETQELLKNKKKHTKNTTEKAKKTSNKDPS